MKRLKSGVVAVGLLLLFGFSVANAYAEYLGEICWSIHITVGDEGPRDDDIYRKDENHSAWGQRIQYTRHC